MTGPRNHPVVHVAYEDAEAYAAGPARRCRPRRNGNSRHAAGLIPRLAWGEELSPDGRPGQYLAGPLPLAETSPATASSAPRRSPPTRRTASACTTWPAMSGSGPPTGPRRPPWRRPGEALLRAGQPARPRRWTSVSIPPSPPSASHARWSRAARISVRPTTAAAIGLPRGMRRRSIRPRATSDFDASGA